MMSGVARKSILPMLVGLKPKASAPEASRPVESMPKSTRRMPSQVLAPEMLALAAPTMSTMMLPTARPMIIESMEASTVRVPSLRLYLAQTFFHAVASFPCRFAPAM